MIEIGENLKEKPKTFFKATFKWDAYEVGRTVWQTEIKVFDAETADELNEKINEHIASDHKGFRRLMQLTDIVKM